VITEFMVDGKIVAKEDMGKYKEFLEVLKKREKESLVKRQEMDNKRAEMDFKRKEMDIKRNEINGKNKEIDQKRR